MRGRSAPARLVSIVLGCGDVGSAVAVALHQADFAVVLVDEADPAWHRRGMAFTNAWYVGNAELDGIGACFCASIKSIPSVLTQRMIAATTWSWPGVAGVLAPTILVDTREAKRRGTEVPRGRLPFTIGVGSGFVPGADVDLAIALDAEASWTIEAARAGRFVTERRIGDAVRRGQIVGGLGGAAIVAPAGGALLGLAARGARIEPGDRLIEIDPAGVPHRCYGIGARQRQIAADVMAAIARRQHDTGDVPLSGEAPDRSAVVPMIRPDLSLTDRDGARHA